MMPVLLAVTLLVSAPPAAGMSAERLARIDAVVTESIAKKECPGAVVLVGRHGKVVFRKAYGNRAVAPAVEAMTVDTVFDMASLTKVVATATSVMMLVEDGKIRLQDRVAKHIPEFASGGGARDQVTIEELLTHRAGLAADDPMALYTGTREEIFERKYRQPLANAPGARFLYSDVGYEVLGELVRTVSGQPLDEYAARHVFEPLGMTHTGFLPLSSLSKQSLSLPLSHIAPTEKINGTIRRGAVHDPRAYALGGGDDGTVSISLAVHDLAVPADKDDGAGTLLLRDRLRHDRVDAGEALRRHPHDFGRHDGEDGRLDDRKERGDHGHHGLSTPSAATIARSSACVR